MIPNAPTSVCFGYMGALAVGVTSYVIAVLFALILAAVFLADERGRRAR